MVTPRTRRIRTAIAVVLAAGIALGPFTAAVGHAQQISYGTLTRSSLQYLLDAAERLRTESPATARQALAGMGGAVDQLTKMAIRFRERSNSEYERCSVQKTELENRMASLDNDHKRLDAQMIELEGRLEEFESLRRSSQAAAEDARRSIEALQAAIAERQRRLEELRSYWWVPGYNVYLGIRTAVDDDVGTYMRLRSSLADAWLRLSGSQSGADAARKTRAALELERQEMARTRSQLEALEVATQASLGRLKDMAIFLTEAELFWKGIEDLLRIDVSQSVSIAQRIATLRDLANKRTSVPHVTAMDEQPLAALSDSLLRFADAIDSGRSFLLLDRTDACGGPSRRASADPVSVACNIERFTEFYEIVDPKTCAFRYLNPPGCPPLARSVTPVDDSVADRLRSLGLWQRVDDQNWIGRNRCSSADAFFYGTATDASACEQRCMSDQACVSWTFNRNNGYMPNSMSECWGGSEKLTPLTQPWSGFESGGRSNRNPLNRVN